MLASLLLALCMLVVPILRASADEPSTLQWNPVTSFPGPIDQSGVALDSLSCNLDQSASLGCVGMGIDQNNGDFSLTTGSNLNEPSSNWQQVIPQGLADLGGYQANDTGVCLTSTECTIYAAGQQSVFEFSNIQDLSTETQTPIDKQLTNPTMSCSSFGNCMLLGWQNENLVIEREIDGQWAQSPNVGASLFLSPRTGPVPVSCYSGNSPLNCSLILPTSGQDGGFFVMTWSFENTQDIFGEQQEGRPQVNPQNMMFSANAMSCSSDQNQTCVIVGSINQNDPVPAYEIVQGTNLTQSAQTIFSEGSDYLPWQNGFLQSVSCTSISTCTVTGIIESAANDGIEQAAAASYDGTGWSTPVDIGSPSDYALSTFVSCATATQCGFGANIISSQTQFSFGTFFSSSSPLTNPLPPTGIWANSYGGDVYVTWTPPTYNGDSVNHYQVQYSSNGSTWTTATCPASPTPQCGVPISAFSPGEHYSFQVASVDANGGTSSYDQTSSTLQVIPPYPGTPTGIAVTTQTHQANVSWDTPQSDGDPVDHYVVEYQANGSNWQSAACGQALTQSCSITGLSDGTHYLFRVASVDASGGTSSYDTTSTPSTPTMQGPTVSSGPFGGTPADVTVGSAHTFTVVGFNDDESGISIKINGVVRATTTANTDGDVSISLAWLDPHVRINGGQPIPISYGPTTVSVVGSTTATGTFRLLDASKRSTNVTSSSTSQTSPESVLATTGTPLLGAAVISGTCLGLGSALLSSSLKRRRRRMRTQIQ